jgi:hypothetical protein
MNIVTIGLLFVNIIIALIFQLKYSDNFIVCGTITTIVMLVYFEIVNNTFINKMNEINKQINIKMNEINANNGKLTCAMKDEINKYIDDEQKGFVDLMNEQVESVVTTKMNNKNEPISMDEIRNEIKTIVKEELKRILQSV